MRAMSTALVLAPIIMLATLAPTCSSDLGVITVCIHFRAHAMLWDYDVACLYIEVSYAAFYHLLYRVSEPIIIDGKVEAALPLPLGVRVLPSEYSFKVLALQRNGTLRAYPRFGCCEPLPVCENLTLRLFVLETALEATPSQYGGDELPLPLAEAILEMVLRNVTIVCGGAAYEFESMHVRIYLREDHPPVVSFEAWTRDGRTLRAYASGERAHLYVRLEGASPHPLAVLHDLSYFTLMASLYLLGRLFARLPRRAAGHEVSA